MGAGAIGCYLGGCLAAAGVPVTFVGRPRVLDALARNGLTLTDLEGRTHQVPSGELTLAQAVPAGRRPRAGAVVRQRVPPHPKRARNWPRRCLGHIGGLDAERHLQRRHCRAGWCWSEGAAGHGAVQRRRVEPRRLSPRDSRPTRRTAWTPSTGSLGSPFSSAPSIALDLVDDALPIQWGKLMLNLNNPVNALSGLPLRAELMERGYRRCFAALIDEALQVLEACRASSRLRLPRCLRTACPPSCACRHRFFASSPRACCASTRRRAPAWPTTWALGRRTEVDALCGEVVRLAPGHGYARAAQCRMVELIDTWPAPPGRLGPADARSAGTPLSWRAQPAFAAGATIAPWIPCRSMASATKPLAFISSTKADR